MTESNYVCAQLISVRPRTIYICWIYLNRTQLALCSASPSLFLPGCIKFAASSTLHQMVIDLFSLKRFFGRSSRALLPQCLDMFRTSLSTSRVTCTVLLKFKDDTSKGTCRASIRLARALASTFCFLAPGMSRRRHNLLYSWRKFTCMASPMAKKPKTMCVDSGTYG